MNSNINYAYWATREIHDFNVEEFISQVAGKYEQLAQEDSHFSGIVRDGDSLRRLWHRVMNMPSHGDASLYPNANGRREPALMEVWHKAGDFWRAKYRDGDRLLCDQNGLPLYDWMVKAIIACQTPAEEAPVLIEEAPVPAGSPAVVPADESPVPAEETTANTPDPRDEELTALRQQLADLRRQMTEEHDRSTDTQTDAPIVTPAPSVRPAVRSQEHGRHAPLLHRYKEHKARHRELFKAAGMVAAATVALLVIYETGLLIPLGLIGLATSGLVK